MSKCLSELHKHGLAFRNSSFPFQGTCVNSLCFVSLPFLGTLNCLSLLTPLVLNDSEEMALIDTLVCACKQAVTRQGPPGRTVRKSKEKKASVDDRKNLSAHLMQTIPRLLNKVQTDIFWVPCQGWHQDFSVWVLVPVCPAKMGSQAFYGGPKILVTLCNKKSIL